jgi:cell division protein FtsI (penicillin-binding protein 3)
MMQAVVDYGTAAEIRSDRIDMAGKTGTAEKIDAVTGKYVHGLFNSSFMGLVPVERPEFVCLVLLDEPSQLKYGGQSAAPIFREIVDRVLANPEYPLARMARPAPEAEIASARPVSAAPADAQPARAALAAEEAGLSRSPGAQVPRGAMPDLSEHTLRDALFRLKDLGLDVEYDGAGRVIRQQPPAGAPIKPGQKCVLTLGWMG